MIIAYIIASYFGATAFIGWAIVHRGDYYAEMQKQIPKGYRVIWSPYDRGYIVHEPSGELISSEGSELIFGDYERAIQMAIIAERRQRISDSVGESLVDWKDGYAQRRAQHIESMRNTLNEWGRNMSLAAEANEKYKKDLVELLGE